MKVIVALDPDYGTRFNPDLGDAFWLVESASNRALAEKAWATGATDPNSAVFQPSAGTPTDEDVVDRFEDANLHHLAWNEMAFVGIILSSSMKERFVRRGLKVASQGNGFSVLRP